RSMAWRRSRRWRMPSIERSTDHSGVAEGRSEAVRPEEGLTQESGRKVSQKRRPTRPARPRPRGQRKRQGGPWRQGWYQDGDQTPAPQRTVTLPSAVSVCEVDERTLNPLITPASSWRSANDTGPRDLGWVSRYRLQL